MLSECSDSIGWEGGGKKRKVVSPGTLLLLLLALFFALANTNNTNMLIVLPTFTLFSLKNRKLFLFYSLCRRGSMKRLKKSVLTRLKKRFISDYQTIPLYQKDENGFLCLEEYIYQDQVQPCEHPHFSNFAGLLDHMKWNHLKFTSLQCEICEMLFKTQEDKNKHNDTECLENPFECGLCPNRFLLEGQLKHHVNTKHALSMKMLILMFV